MRIASLLDLIWPRLCVSCGAGVDGADPLFCVPCLGSLVPSGEDCCPRCGIDTLDPPGLGGLTCGRCLADEPPFSRARAAFLYGAALRDGITRFKTRPDSTLGPHLGALMVSQRVVCGWDALPPGTLVVPVPSHWRRLLQRGFNPAGLLARGLARALRLDIDAGALRARRLVGRAQRRSRKARKARVAGVYQGRPRALRGRDVLLVDDVITTGATVAAASRACLLAGAASVQVAALARVPLG